MLSTECYTFVVVQACSEKRVFNYLHHSVALGCSDLNTSYRSVEFCTVFGQMLTKNRKAVTVGMYIRVCKFLIPTRNNEATVCLPTGFLIALHALYTFYGCSNLNILIQ